MPAGRGSAIPKVPRTFLSVPQQPENCNGADRPVELTALYQRVIGLDVHQAKITACAIVEHNDGEIEIIEREFGAFKRDRPCPGGMGAGAGT